MPRRQSGRAGADCKSVAERLSKFESHSKLQNLKYRLHQDDYLHTYYPDFYLPDKDQYVEIKGYWWKSQDGKIDDYKKMQKVIEYNNDKRITVLTKVELKDIIKI